MKLVNVHKQIVFLGFFLIGFYLRMPAQVWTMQRFIDSALVNNKNLQMGRNNLEIGKQREKEAKANLIPKIAVNADYKYFSNLPYQLMPLSTFNPVAPEGQFKEAQFGVPHIINANIQLAMPLYNPQIYGAIRTAQIASELTQLNYQKTEEQISFEITNLYYNAQILHHQLSFVDSNLINAQRLLLNMQKLNEQLLAKGTDVSKVKLQVTQLMNLKESTQNKYEQVLNVLKFTSGLSIENNIQIDPTIQFQKIDEYQTSATLDIRISKTQKLVLESELRTLNRSMFFPSIQLFGTYGTNGFGYTGQPERFLNFYPIGFAGVQLSYSLFNGTVTQRKINQKRIELQNSNLNNDLTSDQNTFMIKNAKLQKNVAKKSVETSSEQIELAKEIYEQTILQKKEETASLTDILLADNALREAQQTYLNAVIEYLKADIDLKKLTGNISTTK